MSEAEQLRLVTFRSKFLQHAKQSGNVSATCRYFGISREKFYKWKRRFDELGDAGLADRPTRPHRSPNATPAAVERIPGTKQRLYQFTAIDDCTRIRVLKVCERGKIYA